MKEVVRYGFILSLICIIASAALAGMNSLTKNRIMAQAKSEEENSLKELLPQAVGFEAVKSKEEIIYYRAFDKEGRPLGVAFKALGKGYSSSIETLVAMQEDGTFTAIKVISQNETPGLGARITQSSFTGQFSGKKDFSGVEAITGATISSRAVMDSVGEKAEEIKSLIRDEK